MYEKYLEIFALSDVFGDYVKYLREKMQFSGSGAAVYLMRRWFYAFPELTYEDWVNILNAWDEEHNPGLPGTPAFVPLHECAEMDRILRKRLEKSTAHWQDDSDPVWRNLYYSRNIDRDK